MESGNGLDFTDAYAGEPVVPHAAFTQQEVKALRPTPAKSRSTVFVRLFSLQISAALNPVFLNTLFLPSLDR